MIKVHKVTAYQNAEGVNRVMVTAVKETPLLGGLASSKQFGSIVLKEGTTEEEANEALPIGSELKGLKMTNPDEDGFYRLVAA